MCFTWSPLLTDWLPNIFFVELDKVLKMVAWAPSENYSIFPGLSYVYRRYMLLNFCLFFFCLLQEVSDKNLEGWKEIFLPLPRTPNSSSIQCLCLWMNCTELYCWGLSFGLLVWPHGNGFGQWDVSRWDTLKVEMFLGTGPASFPSLCGYVNMHRLVSWRMRYKCRWVIPAFTAEVRLGHLMLSRLLEMSELLEDPQGSIDNMQLTTGKI